MVDDDDGDDSGPVRVWRAECRYCDWMVDDVPTCEQVEWLAIVHLLDAHGMTYDGEVEGV